MYIYLYMCAWMYFKCVAVCCSVLQCVAVCCVYFAKHMGHCSVVNVYFSCASLQMHPYMYVRIHKHIHKRVCIYLHWFTQIYICVCILVWMHLAHLFAICVVLHTVLLHTCRIPSVSRLYVSFDYTSHLINVSLIWLYLTHKWDV